MALTAFNRKNSGCFFRCYTRKIPVNFLTLVYRKKTGYHFLSRDIPIAWKILIFPVEIGRMTHQKNNFFGH